MKTGSKNIAVIGSGVAGLASAAQLAAQGHKVTCFESNSYYGGKLTAFETNGYRFDAGPSLFTMPQLLDDVFLSCGKDPRHYFNYIKKDLTCNYFFNDGTIIHGWSDIEKLSREMELKTGVPSSTITNYLASSKKKYERVGHIFLTRSLHKTNTWLRKDILKALFFLPTYHLFKTMNKVNEQKLKHPKLIQYFNRYATYNGSNPYSVPGLLTMIPHLEHGIGTFLPTKGMHDISTSLFQLGIDLGVQYKFDTCVTKICTENGKTTGIEYNHSFEPFDLVVCNMDIAHAYQKLLPQLTFPTKVKKQERSSSALIFYWGIKKTFPKLDLHNIFFSQNYKDEFDCIFKKGNLYNDPTVYINITSKNIPNDAPKECENWFVMINLPANKGYYNKQIEMEARKLICTKINKILDTKIEDYIECEEVLNPASIEQKTGSLHGSLYGTSSNSTMAAFNRHANFTSKVKNLYFCGGSVHPGGGIPLCLNSAKIVSDLIKNA